MSDYALHFDGALGSYASPAILPPVSIDTFSYSFWLTTGMTGIGRLFTSILSPNPAFYVTIEDGKIRAYYGLPAVEPQLKSESSTLVNDNRPHHIAIVVGAAGGIYIDGVSEGSDIDTMSTIHATNYIGGLLNSAGGYIGLIDDFRCYKNIVLSSAQVAAIIAEKGTVDEDVFDGVADDGYYINFNEGSGSSIASRILASDVWSSNNGSIAGGVTWILDGIFISTLKSKILEILNADLSVAHYHSLGSLLHYHASTKPNCVFLNHPPKSPHFPLVTFRVGPQSGIFPTTILLMVTSWANKPDQIAERIFDLLNEADLRPTTERCMMIQWESAGIDSRDERFNMRYRTDRFIIKTLKI